MKYTLYYTPFTVYEACPQEYLWGRGWGTIDLGAGPGKPKPKPFRKSKHHAVMGIVIQSVIERLYNDELWRDPKDLLPRLHAMIEPEWDHQANKPWNWVDYRIAGTRISLIQQCKDAITGYLRTMKHQKLIGEWAKAEFELLGFIDKANPIGGRCDLIFRRKDTGLTILDGKNSGAKGKYTSPDQLRWYAMCYYLAYRQLPDRLGFVYYRFPYGTPILGKDNQATGEIEQGVDWITFTKADLQGLAKRAMEVRAGIMKEHFEANPNPSHCRWCEFETECPMRMEQKAANRRKSSKAIEAVSGAGDFVDFAM